MNRKLCVFVFLIGLFVVSSVFGGEIKSASVEKDGFSASSYENDLIVYYFYGEGCPHCAKVKPFLDEMEQKYPLHLHKYDIYTNRGYISLFDEYSSRYDIPLGERGVPALFVSDTFFVGDSPILDGFEQVVKRALEERSPTERVSDVETPENLAQETATMAGEVTIFAVTVAALVDAVSPCSIAILVFLIGARVLVAGQRKRALKVGLAFCLSVFIGYFLFGLGLFTIVQTSGFSGTFSLLVGLIAILAGIFYLKDVFWYGRGGFAMEVPRSLKPLLMKMLKGVTSPFGAFAMGFVVVCFELPCTGGPYLFILGQLADNATRLQAIPLLLYYNVIFVLPLVIISLLLYSNLFSVGRVREWNEKNKRLLRLVGGFAMVALGFLVIPASQMLQLFWMFLGFFKAFGPHLLVIMSLYLAVSFGMQKNLRSRLMRLPGRGVLLLSLIFMPVLILPTSIDVSYTTPPPPPSPPKPDRADTILMGSEGIREEIDIPSFLRGQSSDISGLEGWKGTDGTSLLDLLIQDDLRERENAGVGGPMSIQSIVSCTTISSPGVYTLTADIIDSSATVCMNITSSNVVLDGAGFAIDGIDGLTTYGVYVYNPSTSLMNITVKNLKIKDWGYAGIYYRSASNGSIENNIITSNRGHGIYFVTQDNNNTLTNNNVSFNDGAGIYINYGSGNSLINNTIWKNAYNVMMEADKNILTNNTIIGLGGDTGIEFDGNNNTFSSNYILNHTYGVIAGTYFGAVYNLFYNNYFNNTNNYMEFYPGMNYLNTTKRSGTNIVGGPYIGGNFWAEPDGTGFSELCNDFDSDGICDSSYSIGGATDYLPLAAWGMGPGLISDCTVISEPGDYVVVSDINDSTSQVCINITSSDVNLDGYGHTIDGINSPSTYGVYVYNSSTTLTNVIVENLTVTDWDYGIHYENTQNGRIENNSVNSNNNGLSLNSSASNNITDNTILNNYRGISLNSSNSNVVTDNTISNNDIGIFVNYSSSNSIYNNYFRSIDNFEIYPTTYSNDWNTTRQSTPNIISGPNIGGNYWSKPDGTGFSDTCVDSDNDGICDSSYTLGSGNIDYLPLTDGLIGSCTEIMRPGYYYLTVDILNSPSERCINITASNVIFDGQAHTLESIPSGFPTGVYVHNPSTTLTNVTVKNLVLKDWYYNIHYDEVQGGYIENNIIISSDRPGYGIYISDSDETTIRNNLVSTMYSGILISSTNDTQVIGNDVTNTSYGIRFYYSNFTIVSNNSASLNGYGIYLGYSYNNTLVDNNANNNTRAIYLYYSRFNLLANNTVELNSYGIIVSNSYSNTIYNNYFNNDDNVYIYPEYYRNYWNVDKQLGTNIVEGPYLGGNFWAWPNGTGFSQTCLDSNVDGICDDPYYPTYPNTINVDQFPLKKGPIGSCREISSPGYYILAFNIIDSSATRCFEITSSDVILDGAGRRIDGVDTPGTYGVYVRHPSLATLTNVTVKDLKITNWYMGIRLDRVQNSVIESNNVASNTYGIHFVYSSDNTIYNNYFRNTNNWGYHTTSNYWNTTEQSGTNIVGGPSIGGNYWANPDGTGFSELCADSDKNGICDSSYPIVSGNIDYLPLSNPNAIDSCTVINSPGTYVLTADIIGSSAEVCIEITASDVIFNGAGHRIDGVDDPSSYGVKVINSVYRPHNVTVKNLIVTDWSIGIWYYSTREDNTIENNRIDSNGEGIRFSSIQSNTIVGNMITDNSIGLELESVGSHNLVYNNYFNNFQNFGFSGTIFGNDWNTTKTLDTNILGGPYIGGNYWGKPDGTGFSDTCTDSDGDYICDSSHTLLSPNNIDYLPLARGWINSCTKIFHPGHYTLSQSILDSSATRCIEITSSNVILDGNNNMIDGIDASLSYGVYVYNPSTRLTNVTVKNLRVKGWRYGIYYKNTDYSSIENNIPSYNSRGIYLDTSHNNTIRDNMANGYDDYRSYAGIYLTNSFNNTVEGNRANSNWEIGIYLVNSDYNHVIGNTASNQRAGIELVGSRNNVLEDNRIGGLNRYGIILNSDYNNITGNYIFDNGYGIYLWSNNNIVRDNGLSHNGFYNPPWWEVGSGLWLGPSSEGNTIYNNFFDNYNGFYGHVNVEFAEDGYSNTWNTTEQEGKNILGRSYLGGNYWSDYDQPSEGCTDSDRNGICDSSHTLLSPNNIDYLPLAPCIYGTIDLTSCGKIECPGYYRLANNILDSSATRGIEIAVGDVYVLEGPSDVTLDGQGYQLDGIDVAATYGVYVTGSSDVTVKNLTVTDWDYGIYYGNSQNGRIESNTANSNTVFSIYISSSDSTVVANNTNSNTVFGIYISSSNSTVVANNTVNWSDTGIAVLSSEGNTIERNTVSNNNWGIFLDSSNLNTIIGNTPSNNIHGIYVMASSSNNITGNMVSNNSDGIRLYFSNSNTIYNNIFNNTLNAYDDGVNFWNRSTPLPRENILGGPYIGGNFWSDYTGLDDGSGTGVHAIAGDYIGDTELPYDSSGNIAIGGDFLPIVIPPVPCGTVISEDTDLIVDVLNCMGIGLIIGADDITLDVKGHTISGVAGSTFGIYLNNKTNVNIKNSNIRNYYIGIFADNAENANISNNNLESNYIGLRLLNSHQNEILENNIRSSTLYGVQLLSSSNNKINDNTLEDNNLGLHFLDSESYYNEIGGNLVNGDLYYHFVNNMVGGIFENKVLNASDVSNLGKVSLINCSNFILKNLTLENNELGAGLFLYNSDNNSLNITASNNAYGIRLESSYNNDVEVNAAQNYYGIFLNLSSGNEIFNSNTLNNHYGIYLAASSGNNLTNIHAEDNYNGILLSYSNQNNLTIIKAYSNVDGIFLKDNSSENSLSSLDIRSNNKAGLRFDNSSKNRISDSYILDSGLYDFTSTENSLNHAFNMRINTTQISFEGLDISIRYIQIAPEDPQGFSFGIGKYLEIDKNSGNSWIFLNMTYEDLGSVRETSLNLLRFDSLSGLWRFVPGSTAYTGEDEKYVSANITSFSIFGILGVIRPTRVVYEGYPCVTGDAFYTSIDQAATDSDSGDRIIVCPGDYTEFPIVVDKTVDITSYTEASETIVNAASGDLFQISASGVNVTGLTLKNAGVSEAAAIRLSGSNCIISSNIIDSNYYGVTITGSNNVLINNAFERNAAGIEMNSGSYDNNITENTFSYNEKGVWARSATSTNNFITSNEFSNNGQGISLIDASSYNIENNVIFSNTDGIYLQFSSSNEIVSNIIYNQNTAIYAYQSNYNNLENNIITNNDNGVHVRNSRNNTLSHNNLEDNINGTRIYDSIYISVANNYLSNNTLNGIYLVGSDFSNISSNLVTLSERGIHLINSYSNTISENIAYGNNKSSIRLTRSENNNITKNVVYWTRHGIYLDDSSYNKIEENQASRNFEGGITVTYGSTYNVISSNTIKQNGQVGIYVYSVSNSNNLTDNTIEAQGEFGITLTTLSSYNTLSENFVGNNTLAGIFLVDSADANVIRNNTIQDHVNQGLILNGSVNNLVYQNNFLFNSNPEDCRLIKICQAFDNTNYNNAWDNGPVDGGNYWSDYDEPSEGCNDVNADGFCDDPYTKITNGTDNYPVTSYIGEYSLEVEVGILDDENRFIIVQLVDTKGNPVMVSGREVAFYDVSSRSSPLILGEFSQVLTTTDEFGKAYTVYTLPKELDLATISVESEEVREEIDIPSFIEFPKILQVEQKFRRYFVQGYELTNEMNILTDWGIMIRPRKIIFDRPGGPYIEIPFEEIVPLTSITLDGALYPRGSNNTLTFDMGSLPIGADPITITAVGDITNSSISDVYFIVLEKHNALEGLGGLRDLKPAATPSGWVEGEDYVVYTSNLELTTNIVDQYIKQKISDALEEAIGIPLPIDKIDDTIKKIRNIFKLVRDVQQKDYSQIAIDIADALMDLGIISFEQRADLIAWLIDESFAALKFLDWILTNDVIQYTETFLEYVPSFDLPDFIPYVGGSYGVDLNSLVLFDYAEYNTLDGTASTTTGGKVTIRLGETVGNANLMISGTNAYGPAGCKLELIQKRYDFQISGRVPVYEWNFGVAKIGIAIEYQAKLYIVYVPVGETIRFDLGGVDIEVTALGYGKIDIVIASASFELGVGVGIGAEVSRARGFEITSLRGLLVVRLDWKLLFYKDHWGRKWICDIWPAIQGGDVNCWEEEASEPEGWMVKDRDYVNDNYAEFVANQGISHSSPTTETMLILNIFPEADPQLALNKDNDNLMTVYVHDDISKNITQSFEIYYTRWDGFNWTVPAPITNDYKPDVKPDVVFDSYGNAVAVWVSVNNETLTNETRLDETIRYAEIAYSIFDSSLNEWTEPELLTDNDFFDYDPTLAAGKDGKVMAIWYADEDNTIFIGHNATDEHDLNKTVYFSIWNGSAWSSPAPAITDISLSNKMEFDYTGDEAIIVWGQDMDGNSSTLEDREIVYSTWDGNSWSAPVRLTNNSFEDRLPTVIYDDEEILLAWESIEYPAENVTRYKIRYSTFNGTWSEATEITDTGQVEQLILTKNPQENTVLIWQTTSDQGTDMFYSVLDKSHNRWGAENQLTNDDSADVKYSSVINSNNDIISSYIKTEVLLRNETVTVSNETFSVTVTEQGNSSLFLLTHHIFTDIEINDEDIILSNANPAPGEIITINATVHNVGDLSVDDIRVRFSDGYPGTQIGTTQIIDSIPAGENKTVSVQWKIPATSQFHDIYVELDPLNDIAEENETNNIANIRTVLPDIAIGFAQANNLDGEVIINASITNIGHVSASNIPVSFYFSDSFDNKTLIGTETISYLEPGAEENVSIVWNTTSLPAGHYFVFVVIDPNDVIIEGDETNNVDMIIVKSFTDLAIKDIVVSDVIEGDVTFNATISNLGSFDSYNVTLQVFKDIPFYVEESTGLFSAPRVMLNESLLILNETIPFIGARENITVSGNWYATPGYYDIYAIVDPYELIKETDDSNNVDSIGLRILQKLNLTSIDATDIDNDGLFDYVSAKVEADIPSDGYYYLTGNLTDNTGTQITTASNLTYLTAGPQNITINFNGILIRQHAANGTYTLKDVKLYDSTSLLGQLLGTHPTPDFTYTQFQTQPATLVAVISDQGIDLDQDGLYDFLEVEANINVTKAGNYNVRAILYDFNGNYTASARNSTYLNTGIQALKLRFSGRAIFSHGVDGPYNLSYIALYNENWNEIDREVDAYITAAYAYTWFEGVKFDIAIRDVTPSQTIVGQGSTISINVTVTNQGAYTETFNVTAYYASDPIETQTVTNLPSGTSTNLTFLWNTTGVPYGNYTISAYAALGPSETDTADNTYIGGAVLVTIPGDVDGDRDVDYDDFIVLAGAYGSSSGQPAFRPEADIDIDDDVDYDDFILLAGNYGRSWRVHVAFEEAHLSLFTIGANPAYEVTGGYAGFADYLIANGYSVSTIDPGTTIELSVLAPVDVLVIVAPNQSYATSEIDAIETWVKGGGTLLLITDWDDYGLQASSIAARFGCTLRFDWILDSDENLGGFWGWPYYEGANLLTHQITAGVARVEMYASDGITGAPGDEIPLIVTDSDGTAVWYSDSSPALGVSLMSAIDGGTAGSGRLILVTDSNLWDSAYDFDGDGDVNLFDSDHEVLALNVINWLSTVNS